MKKHPGTKQSPRARRTYVAKNIRAHIKYVNRRAPK